MLSAGPLTLEGWKKQEECLHREEEKLVNTGEIRCVALTSYTSDLCHPLLMGC